MFLFLSEKGNACMHALYLASNHSDTPFTCRPAVSQKFAWTGARQTKRCDRQARETTYALL